MNVYFCRINLSIAMVAMVGVDKQSQVSSAVCPHHDNQSQEEKVIATEGEFDWSKSEQGLVMGSYYWSYTAAQVTPQVSNAK